ncbi:MAG: hypothetical protein ACTSX8_00150, partial [Alphaproteobacteria bacterium]
VGNTIITGDLTVSGSITATAPTRWTTIVDSKYTSAPASTSRITMSDTGDFLVGYPARWTQSAVAYYSVVVNLSANSWIDLSGPPLITTATITLLEVGVPEQVIIRDYQVSGTYADATDPNLLDSPEGLRNPEYWQKSEAYLVAIRAMHRTDDSGANPNVTASIAGDTLVHKANANTGPTVSTSFPTITTPDININSTKYKVEWGDEIEVAVTKDAGGNSDAANLSVWFTFVVK